MHSEQTPQQVTLRSSAVFSNLLRKYAAVVNSQQINYKCHVVSLHRVMFTLGFFSCDGGWKRRR